MNGTTEKPRSERNFNFHTIISFSHTKNVLLIKTCSDGSQCKVRIGNYLSSSFTIENGLKKGAALSPLLFYCDPEYAIRKVQETNL